MKYQVTIPLEDIRSGGRSPEEICERAIKVLDNRCLSILKENTSIELVDYDSFVSRTFHLFNNQQLEEFVAKVRAEAVDEIYNVEVGDSYE